MAKRHNERDDTQDEPTSTDASQEDPTGSKDDHTGDAAGSSASQHAVTRRSFAKAIGAAATLGGGASLLGNAAAASLDSYLEPDGEVTIPTGEYSWSGSGLDVGSGDALIGEGNPGDVVWNLDSGTMDGNVAGRLENVVVRGSNKDAKAGINLRPGATVDGFVWPEGGQQDEDRAFYTPDGGDDRLTIRNSAWAWMVNNGAYVDKPPVTMENCAAVNNNIANVRVGHRDGTSSGKTTYVRNTLIAVTEDILNDDTNSSNSRGLRLRKPANLVIENCWFVYLDVSGTADLIELHDGAAGSTVTIRDCAFYNDSNGDLVRDKSGGEMDVTIENCTVAGSGSREVDPDFSGSGFTEDESVDFPLPSEVTGNPVADEIEGIGDGVGPFDGSTSTSTTSDDNTLVLHGSPDNSSPADVSFTVTGDVEFAAEAESGTDTIVANDDGTTTATSISLSPDELDSYRFTGDVVGYSVPDGIAVDVSVNGTTTSFDELVGDTETEDDVLEVVARQSGELNYEFDVDGSVELYETSDKITSGNGDSVTDNGDGTVTVTGFTGNDGYGDAYLVSGAVTSFSWDPDDYDFDVILNDETVAPENIADAQNTATEDGSTDDGSTGDSTSDDGTSDGSTDDSTSDGSTDDSETDGSTDDSETDGSTDDGTSGGSTDDGTSDDTSGDTDSSTETPHLLTVDGNDAYDVTTYTFTVTGDVERDEVLSAGSENGTNWHRVQDFDSDGKVIGLVGGGIDAFRFSGEVEEITVNGDANVALDWNA
ncbi:hypothetical protein [Halobacterium bonnevillei]|uniref:Right handed beta helix domain-containing protein n=1 Tax=Halobacterium bonnevillei TaxID=2692200 RepID=A0A6B0SH53_9EURY|nr:hypothetical protein [Halobacterium bonnevillei]MXR20347.1 hypothetical protein [Halobacterium bonnevillei]